MTDGQNWWEDAVVYQVYPRSFADSNGDGVGDLPGVRSKLPYLADLGVDAIWLTPFYPSPLADGGYDVSDYCDVDPLLGTLADFDGLVKDASAHGIRVIQDLVIQHVHQEHEYMATHPEWFNTTGCICGTNNCDWTVHRLDCLFTKIGRAHV